MMKRCRETLYESGIFADNVLNNWECREFKKDICDFVGNEDETIAETEEELMARVETFKMYLREIHRGRSILVISHGDFLNRLSGNTVNLKNAEMAELELSDVYEEPLAEAPVEAVAEAQPVESVEAVAEAQPVESVESVAEAQPVESA
jgi:hypothetical protein